MRIATWGHAAFAATMIYVGALGLVQGDFPSLWIPVPQAVPARHVLVYLCAIITLATGAGLLWRGTAAVASRVLLGWLLAWLLVLRVPHVFVVFGVNTWWAAARTAAMVGGAWVLYTWFVSDHDRQRFGFATGDTGLRIARALYGVALIPFGVAHFLYVKETAVLVPKWLPWHVAWAYLTGAAFIAAGVAILSGVRAPLAAALSALQMGLFTLLVWVPVVVSGASAFQWQEFVTSVALTAAGWVVTDSYRGAPVSLETL